MKLVLPRFQGRHWYDCDAMKNLGRTVLCSVLFCTAGAQAQLFVKASPPKVTGNKVVVPLTMQNNLSEKIESARAVVFLLDAEGKMVGQSTKWIIGGAESKSGLAAGATNSFHFVITSDKPFTTTNLAAKLSFSRVVLEGGKLADTVKNVQIQNVNGH